MVRHRGVMQAGAVFTEAAVVLPTLLVLILLLIDFSWTLSDRITLTEAARHGARFSSGLSLKSGACVIQQQQEASNAARLFIDQSGSFEGQVTVPTENTRTLMLNSNCLDLVCNPRPIYYIEVTMDKGEDGRPSVFEELFRARPARFPVEC